MGYLDRLLALNNVFVERLWRSVKYEEVYLADYGSPRAARLGLTRYFEVYFASSAPPPDRLTTTARSDLTLSYARSPARVFCAGTHYEGDLR
jgi:hypothetical protein